jgi:hypothetical protein
MSTQGRYAFHPHTSMATQLEPFCSFIVEIIINHNFNDKVQTPFSFDVFSIAKDTKM